MPPARTRALLVGLPLLLMSFASGGMDIVSFGQFGPVFTSAMTGNAALLGLALGQGDLAAASRNLAAFAGFVAGLALGATALRADRPSQGVPSGGAPSGGASAGAGRPAVGWSRVAILLVLGEEALLLAFAVLSYLRLGQHGPGFAAAAPTYGLIGLSAVAMGVQSTLAQHFGVSGVTTTYFTGTLTRIVSGTLERAPDAAVARRSSWRPSWPRVGWPALAFLAYIGGAAVTGRLLLLPPPGRPPGATGTALAALPAAVIALVLLIALLGAARPAQAASAP